MAGRAPPRAAAIWPLTPAAAAPCCAVQDAHDQPHDVFLYNRALLKPGAPPPHDEPVPAIAPQGVPSARRHGALPLGTLAKMSCSFERGRSRGADACLLALVGEPAALPALLRERAPCSLLHLPTHPLPPTRPPTLCSAPAAERCGPAAWAGPCRQPAAACAARVSAAVSTPRRAGARAARALPAAVSCTFWFCFETEHLFLSKLRSAGGGALGGCRACVCCGRPAAGRRVQCAGCESPGACHTSGGSHLTVWSLRRRHHFTTHEREGDHHSRASVPTTPPCAPHATAGMLRALSW